MSDCSKYTRKTNKMDIIYRALAFEELTPALFADFCRRQIVTKCWRRVNGEWVIRDDPFIDDWSAEEYELLCGCLRNTISKGGFVYGAFSDGVLKGFVSVENGIFGGEHRYMDLSSIHVSEELRGRGIGSALFLAAKAWAGEHGAKKLYISAHSAVESQAFYKKLGCVEAMLYNKEHAEKEPFDCQLEAVVD